MAAPQFDYRLSAVVDLDTSEYRYASEEKLHPIDPRDFERELLKIPSQKKPRTDLQRKADWYVEQQDKKLKKEKGDV